MCGRYKLQHPHWVEHDFAAVFPTLADVVRRPRYNIAPGQLVLAVSPGPGSRTLEQMHWGIAAPWKGGPARIINARAEKLAASRFWKPLFEQGRCAIPADGFYEWRAAPQGGGRKQPFLFGRADGAGFWFAGVRSAAREQDAPAANECAIVTVEPNDLVEGVHDRMPALLDRDDLAEWLEGAPSDALGALRPYPSAEMSARAIDPAIGNPSREGPQLIAPAAQAPPQI
jgi:putative SOS response-associated peptidase YedK